MGGLCCKQLEKLIKSLFLNNAQASAVVYHRVEPCTCGRTKSLILNFCLSAFFSFGALSLILRANRLLEDFRNFE